MPTKEYPPSNGQTTGFKLCNSRCQCAKDSAQMRYDFLRYVTLDLPIRVYIEKIQFTMIKVKHF